MFDKIIAVDFDGTLAYGTYPQIEKPNLKLIHWLKEQKKNGCKLILWTMREDENLERAVKFCSAYELEFDAINDNLESMKKTYGNNPRKIFCDYYIDDTHFTSEYLIHKTKIETEKEVQRINRRTCIF